MRYIRSQGGILIPGQIGSKIRMNYDEAIISEETPGPPPWTPEELNPLFWFDPSDEYTDGASVGSWALRTGSQGTTLTSSGTARPTRSTLNGQRILAFDRTLLQIMSFSSSTAWTLGIIICVAQYVSTNWPGQFEEYDGLLTENTNNIAIWVGVRHASSFYNFGLGGYHKDGASTYNAGIDSAHIYRFTGNTEIGCLGMIVGRDRQFSERYWNGLIGDIIGLPLSTSAEDISKTEEYLATKYSITPV